MSAWLWKVRRGCVLGADVCWGGDEGVQPRCHDLKDGGRRGADAQGTMPPGQGAWGLRRVTALHGLSPIAIPHEWPAVRA